MFQYFKINIYKKITVIKINILEYNHKFDRKIKIIGINGGLCIYFRNYKFKSI
jgi:hypothetical protein